MKDFSDTDLILAKQEIEKNYPFLKEFISELQLSNKQITNGGLAKGGPDKINKILKGESKLTDEKTLRKKIASLKAADGSGVVAIGEIAETPEESKDLDYSEFIDQLTDAISDLKKDAGADKQIWAARLQAIDATLKAQGLILDQVIKALKAAAPKPEKLGEEFHSEESQGGLEEKKRSKMEEKRASKKTPSKKAHKAEEEEEEADHYEEDSSETLEEDSAESSTPATKGINLQEDAEEEEEEEEEAPKMEAKKAISRDRAARQSTAKGSSGKGVNNTDENAPNFPKEYAWMADILKAGKKSWGGLQ